MIWSTGRFWYPRWKAIHVSVDVSLALCVTISRLLPAFSWIVHFTPNVKMIIFFLRSQLLCQDTAERRTVYSIFAFRFRLTPQIITWRCHIVFQWTAIPHIGYSVQIHPENNYLPIKHRISREADSRDCILFKCQARVSSADVTMIYILGCSHLEGNASTAFSYVGITGSEKKEEENLLGLCF